jgi:hypothetical protein
MNGWVAAILETSRRAR